MIKQTEDIPYANGRLHALAAEIRDTVQQLPLEIVSPEEKRQTAQAIQLLSGALREAIHVLCELQVMSAAAYTAKLCAAVAGFHLQTTDLRRFIAALRQWAALVDQMLSGTHTGTVSAASAGRMMNHVKLGYYPTDPAHIAYLKCALCFPQATVNLLDPCCGEGNALAQLAKSEDAMTFGVELDESRAEQAQSKLDRVALGSYFFARIARNAFHVLLLNPPYLQVYGEARSEKRFLSVSYEHLMMQGVLFYIIPYYRLTEDVCRFLAMHFTDLRLYRFCDAEFHRFRQVVVIGRRKPRAEDRKTAAALEAAACAPSQLQTVDQIPEGSIPLPAKEKAVSLFQGARFNLTELAAQMAQLGSILPKGHTLEQRRRPPLPLSISQIGLVGGSGLINGLIECEAPHIIKGRIIRERKAEVTCVTKNADGSTTTESTETISNKMVFNILTPDGLKELV